ncbi:hypothetical protein [Brevundimonas goettingensis]|uniref:Uncharacterized protein n=1 Tax=Brevundimonas goettingensis TaxID=2774190 RepID=A0A975BYS1_9CAUL|nr:hypothetical protein [Brevundimonas goettingensis]QTC90163.1 hypothetical protein IFJ75_12835 [Brevundimonas goettingensis]
MTQRREIKQRSPKVWAAAKAAYLAGETAASVARRFDVGYGNLRYRAHAEGWTRKAAMAATAEADAEEAMRVEGRVGERADPAPPPAPVAAAPLPADPFADFDLRCPVPEKATPGEALEAAVRRAGRRLAQGQAREALDLLKAAEALASLTGSRLPTMEELEAADRETGKIGEAVIAAIEQLAAILAESLLTPHAVPLPGFEHFHLDWRARWATADSHTIDVDRERIWATGREDLIALYDEDGNLRPRPLPDAET